MIMNNPMTMVRTTALCGVAALVLLLFNGCADTGYRGGGGGVYYGGVAYSGPYYGGYGPYYGDEIVIGTGYRHRGYYGGHHSYGRRRAIIDRGRGGFDGGRRSSSGRSGFGREAAPASVPAGVGRGRDRRR
jgi:hypothetical protein